MTELLVQPLAGPLVAAHHGGRAPVWIIGWLVVLAAAVALIVYLVRRRRSRAASRRDSR